MSEPIDLNSVRRARPEAAYDAADQCPFETGNVVQLVLVGHHTIVGGSACLVVDKRGGLVRLAFANHRGDVTRRWYPWRNCRLVYEGH